MTNSSEVSSNVVGPTWEQAREAYAESPTTRALANRDLGHGDYGQDDADFEAAARTRQVVAAARPLGAMLGERVYQQQQQPNPATQAVNASFNSF
jgi:hypothetical protein